MKINTRAALASIILAIVALSATAQTVVPTKIRVNGVELTYIERGQGEPLILLHGGQGDYRSWEPQMAALSPKFRVISYSRRYNYPNDNPITSKKYSAYVDADDLAAFIRKLKLKRVHLVGTSIGAFTALILAVKHPEMVRSLVLAEPPVHDWVKDTQAYKDFMTGAWNPAAAAFRAGDDSGGMRFLINAFGGAGTFENLPAAAVTVAMQNSRFFKAATLSSNRAFELSKEKVGRLKMPILLIRGENTILMHKLIIEELKRVLPGAEQAIIPKAGHGSARENPQAFNDAMLKFLNRQTPK